jgi:hypothetical protein
MTQTFLPGHSGGIEGLGKYVGDERSSPSLPEGSVPGLERGV